MVKWSHPSVRGHEFNCLPGKTDSQIRNCCLLCLYRTIKTESPFSKDKNENDQTHIPLFRYGENPYFAMRLQIESNYLNWLKYSHFKCVFNFFMIHCPCPWIMNSPSKNHHYCTFICCYEQLYIFLQTLFRLCSIEMRYKKKSFVLGLCNLFTVHQDGKIYLQSLPSPSFYSANQMTFH